MWIIISDMPQMCGWWSSSTIAASRIVRTSFEASLAMARVMKEAVGGGGGVRGRPSECEPDGGGGFLCR